MINNQVNPQKSGDQALPYVPPLSSKKPYFPLPLIAVGSLCLLFVGFFFLQSRREKALQPEATPSASGIVATQPPSPSPQAGESELESAQTLQRKKTTSTLEELYLISFFGSIESMGEGYDGKFIESFAVKPDEQLEQDYKKTLEFIQNHPDSAQSLFIIEARDLEDQILIDLPLAVDVGVSDYGEPSFTQPGVFSQDLLVPPQTNSVLIRKREAEILDRIYVEDWIPMLLFNEVPSVINSTDMLTISGNLRPEDKAFSYVIRLVDSTGKDIVPLVIELSPHQRSFSDEVNLSNYPNIPAGQLHLEAQVITAFRVFGPYLSDNFIVQASTENIPVEITPKDKAQYTTDEDVFFDWAHVFYNIDNQQGLKKLCQDEGECYELTWSGDGIKFLNPDSFYLLKQTCEADKCWISQEKNAAILLDTLTTQVRPLRCFFQGLGTRTLRLKVTKNGQLLGEDTHSFTVNSTIDAPSICTAGYS